MVQDSENPNAVWVNIITTVGHCMRVDSAGNAEKFDTWMYGRFEQTRFGSRMRRLKDDPTIVCLGVDHKTTRYLVDVSKLADIAIEIKE